MIASGGFDNLVIWSMQDNFQVIKHFHRFTTSMGSIAAAGSGQSGHNADDASTIKAMVSEVNWSHDGVLLAAAIQDYIAIFEIRKLINAS
jgi:hypothetical protein